MTWADLTLSAGQRAALDGFATLGAQVQAATTQAERDAIVPTQTYSQAKAGEVGLADLRTLLGITSLGITFALAYFRKQALAAFDAANP